MMIVEDRCTILQIWETGDAGTSEEAAMELMNRPPSEREVRRAQADREELAERVARAVGEDGDAEAPGGLRLLRRSSPTPKEHGVSSPAFCVIAQGSKEVWLGDDCYRYDADRYLITAAALPTASRVTGASEERPYLGVVLGLDPALVGSVMAEASHLAPGDHAAVRAFEVGPLDAGLLDAVVHLVGLLDAPAEEARFLRPLVTREIVFRLLKGEQGDRLRQIAVLGGHSHRIARALERLREDFDRPLRIEDIARELGMSVSGFHHHFKAVTAMSPCSSRSGCASRRPAASCSARTSTQLAPAFAWATLTPRTSTASTRRSSARRLCATWNGCGKPPPWKAPACEPITGCRSACPIRHRRVSTVLSGRSSSNHAMSPFFP